MSSVNCGYDIWVSLLSIRLHFVDRIIKSVVVILIMFFYFWLSNSVFSYFSCFVKHMVLHPFCDVCCVLAE